MRYVIGVAPKPSVTSEHERWYYTGILIYSWGMNPMILDEDHVKSEIRKQSVIPVFDSLLVANNFVRILNQAARLHRDPCRYYIKKCDTKEMFFKVGDYKRDYYLEGNFVKCYSLLMKEPKRATISQ